MHNSFQSAKSRMTALLGTGALLIGGGLATALFAAGPASADTCANGPAGNCTVTGSASFAAGPLTVQGPDTIGWSATLNGFDQLVAGSADASYQVTDATGAGAGWTVTAAATTFTGSNGELLPDQSALTFDASATDPSDTSDVPDAACATGSSCSLPTSDIQYPVAISTDADGTDQPYAILDAEAGTGLGSILIGQNTPGVFWLSVPATAQADTYTSTITLAVSSGPDGGIGG